MGKLTAEAVVDRLVPQTPRMSPDGRWVVFASSPVGCPAEHPVSGLWLAPADGSEPPREFVAAAVEDREPRWSADAAWVYFLSDRADRGTAQLYRAGLESEPEQLTDWRTGVSDYVLLPDSGAVLLVAPEEKEATADPRVRVVRPGAEAPAWDTVARPDRLWLLDPATRDVRPLGDFGLRHVVEATARPDGHTLAVLTWSVADREPGLYDAGLHLVDPATGARQDLGVPAREAESLTWWRDDAGWHLAYLAITP